MSRILHIGKFFPPFAGGMENFMGDLFPALEKQGCETAALVHDHQLRWSRSFQSVRADPPPYQRIYRAPCYGRVLYAPVSPQFPFWLQGVLRKFRPHLLHLHMPNTSAFLVLLLPGARRLPWVIHWHSDVVSSRLDTRLSLAYRFYKPFEQALLAAGKRIIVTSPPYLSSSEALQPWQNKCRVIPLGLEPARMPLPSADAAAWANKEWASARMRVLTVGRMTYYKGHEVLIRASARIEGLKTIIAGTGERRPHLEQLIAQEGVAHKVKLLGFRSEAEINALFATCDCFCLPSLERTEAFGVVLMEAMRYGKATAVSDIPGSGTGWVARHLETGLSVPPGDPSALARALRQLQNNPDLRKNMGRAAAQRFHDNFQIERIAEKTAALYAEVLAHPEL
ncbi:MAG: glycosyltransferase [Gammaproteobacteria bacterium]|nr:glycosyltransferase [Gammaproteobacteria bacterium]